MSSVFKLIAKKINKWILDIEKYSLSIIYELIKY